MARIQQNVVLSVQWSKFNFDLAYDDSLTLLISHEAIPT